MSRAGAHSNGVSGPVGPAPAFDRGAGPAVFGLAGELRRIAEGLMDLPVDPESVNRAACRLIRLSDALSGRAPNATGTVTAETRRVTAALSPREREIFAALSEGLSIQEIAVRLKRSPKTINNHRTQLMHKLELRNMSELTRLAIRLGITTV